MACSCRKSNEVKAQQVVPFVSPIPVLQDSDSYSFTADTKPDEVCQLCILKHISSAQILLQYSDLLPYLQAAGQVFLAYSHLVTTPRQTQKILYYYTAMEMLQRENRFTVDDLRPVIRVAKHQRPAVKPPYAPMPCPRVYFNTSEWFAVTDAYLSVLGAYCLLFMQPAYFKINLSYAIGLLSNPAMQFVIYDQLRSFIEQLRKVWKIAQQMQQNTKPYFECKQMLQKIILDIYPIYRQLLKEHFQHSQQ